VDEADAVPVSPPGIVVRAADLAVDADAWSRLRRALWPEEEVATQASLREALDPPYDSCVLLALAPGGDAIGFAEAKLRRDYVNGTETSPVGFLEGWYVVPAWRGRGVGRVLIAAVEIWTRERGCSELASDVVLDNGDGLAAHAACGFEETERVVYFRKRVA
jgi:aminoglycoside 6'-N-acetyltransferase I